LPDVFGALVENAFVMAQQFESHLHTHWRFIAWVLSLFLLVGLLVSRAFGFIDNFVFLIFY